MTTIFSEFEGSPFISIGFEKALVYYVKHYGEFTSLDKFAHECEVNPEWVRRCAHSAASKGLIKLTRLEDKAGRPYKVTVIEEETL